MKAKQSELVKLALQARKLTRAALTGDRVRIRGRWYRIVPCN